jgi:hypothetical protein
MQAVQRILPKLMVLGAIGVVLAALFSNHNEQYGSVGLPEGGVVTLPEGTTKVYLDDGVEESDQRQLSSTLIFQVTPVGGGAEVPKQAVGLEGDSEQQSERSQSIGSKDAVVELDVPAAGEYRVTGEYSASTAASLDFGTDPFGAVLDEWKLWGGLLMGAFLISLVPVGRRGPVEDWSDSSESGYKPPGFNPYRG